MLALSVAMQPTQAQVCPDDAIFAQGPADPNSAWIAAGSDAGASVLHYENFLVTGEHDLRHPLVGPVRLRTVGTVH
jgi:hypothetical protein